MSDYADIEAKMLESLELFHYVNRFQESSFALIPQDDRYLLELLSDLRVLRASGIGLLICCRHRDGLEDVIHRLSGFGYRFEYITIPRSGDNSEAVERIKASLTSRVRPIVAFEGFDSREEGFGDFHRNVLDFVCQFEVSKVFFPGKFSGIEIDGRFYSHPSAEEVEAALNNKAEINIGLESLKFLAEARKKYGVELIVLEARSGELFREIFTHRGAGTLFSKHYKNVVRKAEKADVQDIFFLMKPYLASGIILPVSSDEIERDIDTYVVYTVDDQIVASARCVPRGVAFELGKLCTLPRYQGRGRAQELVSAIIEMARGQQKEYVFALTTSLETGCFFEGVGFRVVQRDSLPDEWSRQYDFDRQSKAYRFNLNLKESR